MSQQVDQDLCVRGKTSGLQQREEDSATGHTRVRAGLAQRDVKGKNECLFRSHRWHIWYITVLYISLPSYIKYWQWKHTGGKGWWENEAIIVWILAHHVLCLRGREWVTVKHKLFSHWSDVDFSEENGLLENGEKKIWLFQKGLVKATWAKQYTCIQYTLQTAINQVQWSYETVKRF